jgi:hypothetical protein
MRNAISEPWTVVEGTSKARPISGIDGRKRL